MLQCMQGRGGNAVGILVHFPYLPAIHSRAGMKREDLFQILTSLRKGLIQIAIVVLLLGILCYPFAKTLLRYLHIPLQDNLVAYGIPETFLSLLKLTLYASLFFSVPFVFFHVWKSVSPVFNLKGFRSSAAILAAALFLFYLGASFCYFVTLPFGIQFLIGYQSEHIKPMISVGKFVSFTAAFVFAFGLIFELPLVMALLSHIRVVNGSFLSRNRRYAILLIAMISAVLTPTPDIFNMGLMGGPLYLLFEIGVILVKIIEGRRRG